MAAGGGQRPRLRLSRRRPAPAAGPPSGRPWFLQEVEGGNSEPWAELLRALRPDVDPASAPPLPAFPRQEPQRDLGQAAPSEVYTVGGKAFTWTPFPPALGRFTHRPPRKATGRLGSPTRSPFQCPESESEPSRTVSTKKRPLVAEKPSVEKKPVEEEPSVAKKPSVGKKPSVEEKPAGERKLWVEEKPAGERKLSVEEKPSVGEKPAGERKLSVVEKPSSVAEKPSVAENPLALTCCPMCLVEFSATLSQLDIDAHLAQCLAESTDDIMW